MNLLGMQLADLDINGLYTYADYLKWTFEDFYLFPGQWEVDKC